ncbi:MAG TPA: hypothetical protein VFV88_03020 [Steroidobacteraceae bacterium]|jgi:hypothetical protein|nr:hypothetical protein [Steroidobacteraceae bacterium]
MRNIKLLAGAWLLAAAGIAAAAEPPTCAAQGACAETRSFVATVTGFRTSKQGSSRLVTATVHFVNKTSKPLTLGYVSESGVVLDELGNRYLVPGANAVRAIGEISGTNFDPKFTLPPGEGGDARFELTWAAGKSKAGTNFELDLAIREITPTSGDNYKLGQEHALHFASLGQATGGAAPAVSAAPPPAPTPADACASSPRCFNAGSFLAEVMQVQASAMTPGARHQSVSVNIRFRNVSDKPVILAYRSGSSAALDNFGNGFTWGRPGTHDTSVKGIGMVAGRSADTQFQLAPGQTRNATFGIIRFNAAPPIGNHWNYDVVIEEIEIQPGQVVKSVRQNSLTFANLSAGSFQGVGSAVTNAAAGMVPEEVPADANSLANKIIDLFDKKTQKK